VGFVEYGVFCMGVVFSIGHGWSGVWLARWEYGTGDVTLVREAACSGHPLTSKKKEDLYIFIPFKGTV
jgi:hypothetical protein